MNMGNHTSYMKIILVGMSIVLSVAVFAQKKWLERSDKVKISKEDSFLLATTWTSFRQGVIAKNYQQIKERSLAKVYCTSVGYILPAMPENKLMPVDSFVQFVIAKFYDSRLIGAIRDSAYNMLALAYPDRKVSNFRLKKGQRLILYDIEFRDFVPIEGRRLRYQDYYVFRFVKIDDQYKLFELVLESAREAP